MIVHQLTLTFSSVHVGSTNIEEQCISEFPLFFFNFEDSLSSYGSSRSMFSSTTSISLHSLQWYMSWGLGIDCCDYLVSTNILFTYLCVFRRLAFNLSKEPELLALPSNQKNFRSVLTCRKKKNMKTHVIVILINAYKISYYWL